jgi:hypothetical protein
LVQQRSENEARAEVAPFPSNWTVEVYGDSSQVLYPMAINNEGIAVAQLQTVDGYLPVELSGGQIVMLGDGTIQGSPTAINDEGVIIGSIGNPDGGTIAVVFQPGSVTELNAGIAWDIDNSGTIVGTVNNVPAYWPQGGEPLALPILADGTWGQVLAINENGLMVGIAGMPTGEGTRSNAAVWLDGQIVNGWYVPDQADVDIAAVDVNDAGTIIGETTTMTVDSSGQSNLIFAPFKWQNENLSPVPFAAGDKSCEVKAINNHGWIAGACGVDAEQHAVMWVNGLIVEVGPLLGDGWQAVVATDVNDKGQIIGQGFLNGVVAAFVLTPEDKVVDA